MKTTRHQPLKSSSTNLEALQLFFFSSVLPPSLLRPEPRQFNLLLLSSQDSRVSSILLQIEKLQLHHLNPASSSVANPVQAVTISTTLHHRRSQTTTLLLSVQRRRSHLISPLPRSCASHAVSLPHRIAGNQLLAGIFRRARRKSERTRGRRDPTPDPEGRPATRIQTRIRVHHVSPTHMLTRHPSKPAIVLVQFN